MTITKMPQTFITIEEYLSYQKRKDISLDDFRAGCLRMPGLCVGWS